MLESDLKCPKCGYGFRYKWIPGVSFTAIKLGKYRYMRCPNCKRFALFNIMGGITDKRIVKHLILSAIVVSTVLIIFGIIILMMIFNL